MRILHVCECLPGGPASYLQETLPHQVGELGRGHVGLVVPIGQVPLLGAAADGVDLFTYRQQRRGPASFAQLSRAIRRAVRLFAPDVIHLHSTIAGLVGRLALAGTGKRVRIVYCAHGWLIDPDRHMKMHSSVVQAEKALTHLTDMIVNISPHEPRFLRRYGFNEAKMRLIVSGIADREPPVLPAALPDDGKLSLLFIGRLDYQKGFDLLLDAVGRLPEGLADIVIIGDAVRSGGEPIPNIPAIRYTGWLSRNEVARHIATADAVVMPSRWEGLPLVALEAMRAGKPLIASNKGAFCHLVEDQVTGILVNNEDPDFLATAFAGLSRDQLRAMGLAARQRFGERFGAVRMNRELMALYRELAGRS